MGGRKRGGQGFIGSSTMRNPDGKLTAAVLSTCRVYVQWQQLSFLKRDSSCEAPQKAFRRFKGVSTFPRFWHPNPSSESHRETATESQLKRLLWIPLMEKWVSVQLCPLPFLFLIFRPPQKCHEHKPHLHQWWMIQPRVLRAAQVRWHCRGSAPKFPHLRFPVVWLDIKGNYYFKRQLPGG